MTRRRWIADKWDAKIATLTGEQAAHLARVLRAEPGMIFDVVADGHVYRAEVASLQADHVHFILHEELSADAALPVTLLLSVFKFDRMEWALEKATELGIARIVPVLARRTEKHLAQAAEKRVERWRRIVREAAQQSRRSDVPEIADPIPLKAALEQESDALKILLAETEQEHSLTKVLQENHPSEVALAIGPEGGWTQEELALFAQHPWLPVTLGPRILRAETATIAAVAVVSAFLQP
ncbi:MAG: 16S rRNA (uracil(1498)-N(3))-methyltransferase [Acidobacteriaceae bacterium]